MQLPLIQLLGLATGAVGIVQKAFAQGKSEGRFETQLTSALSAKTDAKNLVSQLLAKKGGMDEEALQSLLSIPSGVLMIQFMTALKEMGVQSSDIGLLLNGKGEQMSDESLKALLSGLGIGGKDLEAILADPRKMSEIKAQLSDSFKTIISEQAAKDGIEPDALFELAASDSGTIDSIIERLQSVKPGPAAQEQTAIPDEAAATTAQTGQAATPSADKVALTIGLIQRNVSHITTEIRAALAQIVKKAEVAAPESAGVASPEEASNPEVAAKVSKAVSTAETTLGLSKDTLKDLFFETNPLTRRQVVEQATEKVNAYLKSQEGRILSPEVKEALSFVKAAMSEEEFSGIDRSLKLWNQGQAISEAKLPVDREMFTALSRNLGGDGTAGVFEDHMQQVIDQLKQTLPSSLKNGEGQVTLRLNPPMLGRVEVSMTMQDGQLQAAFRTDQSLTRDILLQNMSILKDALADQGIKATQFSVSTTLDNRSHGSGFASASHERHGQGFGHQGKGSENQGRSFKENEGMVYAQANYQGLLEGSLDIFA